MLPDPGRSSPGGGEGVVTLLSVRMLRLWRRGKERERACIVSLIIILGDCAPEGTLQAFASHMDKQGQLWKEHRGSQCPHRNLSLFQ